MPSSDDRLRDALHDAAREPMLDGVADQVRAKRSRRRAIRRVEHAALAGALVAGVIIVGIVALDSNSQTRDVTVPAARGTVPVVRVDDGSITRKATVTPLHVTPDEGYLRGPLLVNGPLIELAAYDRVGSSFSFPPSRIVRIEADGTVSDRVDLKGEILSFADGEGARWALTHDKTVIGPEDPEFRVKRIGPDGTVASNPVPPGEQPVGRIAAGGGGVWVPVRDGVLRFDITTGVFAAKIPLPTVTDHRTVDASGVKFVFATDGNLKIRLDPASAAPAGTVGTLAPGTQIVDAASPRVVGASFLLATTTDGGWIVTDGQRDWGLPHGFTPTGISAGSRVVWIEGSSAGMPAVLVFDPTRGGPEVGRILRLGNTSDLSVTFTSAHTAFLASGGSIFRVELPK